MGIALKMPSSTARRVRRIMFFIHLWTGVTIGLWFALIGGSGSIMAWLPELISYEMRARHPFEITQPGQAQIPLSQALAQLQKKHPELKPAELASITVPNERYPFYLVPVRSNGGGVYKIDPYSGTVHPRYRKTDLIIGNIANFHEMLMLGPQGLIANTVGSVFALFILLSGLWLWWPSTLKQLRLRLTVKRGSTPRRLFMDLHNVFGAYLYVILFTASVTAIVLAVNTLTKDGVEKALDRRAGVREEAPLQASATGKRLSDDELVALAKQAVPDVPLLSVRRAVKPGSLFEANFYSQRGFLNGAAVSLDPFTGSVRKLERKGTSSPGPLTVHVLEDLHYGYFGGVSTKLLYTFAGLMPLALFISGLVMWSKRKQAEKLADQRKDRGIPPSPRQLEKHPQEDEVLAPV
jgi:uncharacterized iron-regulated membrane protein